jgi:hypothetical protein
MTKEGFISWMMEKRKGYNRLLCSELAVFRKKETNLKLMLEKSTSEKQKITINNELERVSEEILKIQKELEGSQILKCIEQLESHKKIHSIDYRDNGIIITTKDIICGEKYDYGKYVITISDNILIAREDGYSCNDKQHPFVCENSPCYGIWNTTINKALKNGGIYTIVLASLKLLECNKYYDAWYISPADFYQALKRNVKC